MFSTLKYRLLRRRNRSPPPLTPSASTARGSQSDTAFPVESIVHDDVLDGSGDENSGINKSEGFVERSSGHRGSRRKYNRRMQEARDLGEGAAFVEVERGVGGVGAETALQELSVTSTQVSKDPFMNDEISMTASEVGARAGIIGAFGGGTSGGAGGSANDNAGRTDCRDVGADGGVEVWEKRRRGRELRERVAIKGFIECAPEEERGLLEIARMIGKEISGDEGERLLEAVEKEIMDVRKKREEILRAAGVLDGICGRVLLGRTGEFGDLLALRMTKMDLQREEKEREKFETQEELFFGELRWKERMWDLEEAMGEGRFRDANDMVTQLTVDEIKSRVSSEVYAEFKQLVKGLAISIHKYCAAEVAKTHLHTLADLGYRADVRSALLVSAHELLLRDLANISAICCAPHSTVPTASFASTVSVRLFRSLCLTRALYSRLAGRRSGPSRSTETPASDYAPELFAWVIEQIEYTYKSRLQRCVTSSTDLHQAAEVTRAICEAADTGVDEQLRFLFNIRMMQLIGSDLSSLLKSQKASLAKVGIPKMLARDPLTATHKLTQAEMESVLVSQGDWGVTGNDLKDAVGVSQVSHSAIEICRLLAEFARRVMFLLKGLSAELDKELEGVIAWGIGMYVRLVNEKAARDLRSGRVAMQNVMFVGGVWGRAWGGEIGRVGKLAEEGEGSEKWWAEMETDGDHGRDQNGAVSDEGRFKDEEIEMEVEKMIRKIIGPAGVAAGSKAICVPSKALQELNR